MDDPTTLAYVAGLLDGEGYIGIKRRRPSKANRMASFRYCPSVSISMTDIEGVEAVADLCGGRNLIRVKQRPAPNKQIFDFSVEFGRAAELLRAVLPYLRIKRRQAKLALECFELQRSERDHRTKVSQILILKSGPQKGRPYRVMKHSDEYLGRLDNLYQQVLTGAARSGSGKYFQC